MAKYFYSDANGRKHGPLNDQQLKALAAQGVIKPTTPLETDTGHKGLAGQIPGLFGSPPPSPQPPPVTPPPTPPTTPSWEERAGEAVTKATEWSRDVYQIAKPFVAKATEFSKEVGQKSKSGASLLDAIFDVHFTRFFTVPWTTASWIGIVTLHFITLFAAIGGGGWVGVRYVAAEREVYTNARAHYAARREMYTAEMAKYKTEMEMYKEFERWQKMTSQQRREERQKMEQNREKERTRLERWNNWERGNIPWRPNEPTPPERPRYTGPTWQVIVYPVVFVGMVLCVFSVSLCGWRMWMEFVIIAFRNESNTRVAKEHYKRMEKAQKYDIE